MAIEFRCSQCNMLLRTANETVGKQAKCPQCGTLTTVPAEAPIPADAGGAEKPYASSNYAGSMHGTVPPPGAIPNYLVQAILVTLFCCLPFGIVSIVYAAQVNGRLAGGDYAGAVATSNSAKTWCWVSFLCGLIPTVLYIGFWVILLLSGAAMGCV